MLRPALRVRVEEPDEDQVTGRVRRGLVLILRSQSASIIDEIVLH